MRSPPAHRATTAHVGALFPFVAEPPLPCPAPYIGRDLLGGAFCYDPFRLYACGALTNPNAVVLGQIGRGKSALVKSLLWRMSLFGAQAWVVDPKGEYGPLAAAWGVKPLRLSPGGRLRLNPLDGPPPALVDGGRPELTRRRVTLLGSLAESSLGRPLRPAERAALDVALSAAEARQPGRAPLLPQVVEALLAPAPGPAAELGTTTDGLAADGRDVALELRRLVSGDLRGMFDGPTSSQLRLDASLLVIDLSAVYTSPALGLLMTCATAWVQTALERSGDHPRLLVVDEAWAILSDVGVARWLRSAWKLSRALGVANLAVLHRLSDLRAAGPSGSEQALLAEGLLADSETRIVYAQSPAESEACRPLLGLSDAEAQLLSRLRRGVALWKVGPRSFLVEHRLSEAEAAIVDTDARMTGA
ncbi:MAG TPA: ATP-binding protein [Acidimicrobiales bacterium]|nr:ATP-binding protein [Acidimicrobiales bacterium]